MAIWRTLASVVLVLGVVPGAWAQTYALVENAATGDCCRIQLTMTLAGELRVAKDGQPRPLKLEATAAQTLVERILAVNTDNLPEKSARSYESAQATITVGRDRSQRTLRPDRSLLVAQRWKDQTVVYSPVGALTREELELTGGTIDLLSLPGLLPGRAVAVGDTWKVSNTAAQALCGFEGLTGQELSCKLESVQDQVATVSVSGTAGGIDLGAAVKLTVQASYRFDLGQHRLVALEWKQKDEREQGPVNPASSIEATTKLTRTPVEQPSALSDVALVKVPDGLEPPALMTQLDYHDPKGRFDLLYGRDWQVVGQTEEHLVLRLMDRGDFIAQATLTPWARAEPGSHLSPEEFRGVMAETPGWEAEEEVQAGEIPLEGKCWGYRVSAVGQLDGLKVTQNFYLVAGPRGEQLVLAFTMNPSQVEKLGTRDLSFVGSVEFPSAPKDADKPK